MKQLLAIIFIALSTSTWAQTDSTEVSDTRTIVNSFLTELLEFSKDAGAFAKEQVPLVLKEYIYWGIASSIVWMLPFLAMMYFVPRIWRWGAKEAEASGGLSVFLSFCYLTIGLAGFIYNLLDMTKAIVAPRVYLIETISNLIK